MELQRVHNDWSDLAHMHHLLTITKKKQQVNSFKVELDFWFIKQSIAISSAYKKACAIIDWIWLVLHVMKDNQLPMLKGSRTGYLDTMHDCWISRMISAFLFMKSWLHLNITIKSSNKKVLKTLLPLKCIGEYAKQGSPSSVCFLSSHLTVSFFIWGYCHF